MRINPWTWWRDRRSRLATERAIHEFGFKPVLTASPDPETCNHPRCEAEDCHPVAVLMDFGSVIGEEEDYHEGRRTEISKLTEGLVRLSPKWGLETLSYGRIPKDDPSKESMVEVYIKTLEVGWCPTEDDHYVIPEFKTPEWRWSKPRDEDEQG